MTIRRCVLFALAVCAVPPVLASDRLTDAVRAGDAAAVTALLKQGASGQAEDADGTTALHWAVQADNVDLARALLRAGAHARAANRYGVT
ncbi:MAG TPA: ankyrin repeat domain-containing protein, partial [Gammaproteobacteria bacterium]|nr:ankyrin repeat domain-containing protein [Gammaproteobacteria bacterium]